MNIFVYGNYVQNLFVKMNQAGSDLFDGIELPMTVIFFILFYIFSWL
jgi:hypothetical protein